MNNQKIGRSFELRWAEYLHSLGYWVHFLSPAANGSQPFDIIAIGQTPLQVLAMDCKTLSAGSRFAINRAEENQLLAFRSLNQAGVNSTYFVVECPDKMIRLIPSQEVDQAMKQGQKSIRVDKYDSIHI